MCVGSALTEKERRFIEAFMGPCAGNGTKAAIAAGYGKGGAHVRASRLLRKAKIQAALATRIERRDAQGIADASERDLMLSGIARDKSSAPLARIRAIAELNKCDGRHSMTHNVRGRLTLEEAIELSR
jgi:phage terminase small subunit